MRRVSLLFAFLFVVLLLGFDSLKEYDGRMEDTNRLEGKWKLIQVVRDGITLDDPSREVTYRCGTYSGIHGKYPYQGKYRIDCTHKPHHLDEIQTPDITIKEIYQIDGDTLTIAHMMGTKRPQRFKDEGAWVETYKRVK
jgi:uncharacterized protein (TIGR03067 family)